MSRHFKWVAALIALLMAAIVALTLRERQRDHQFYDDAWRALAGDGGTR